VTEAEWLASDDPGAMLNHLQGKVSDRRLRLFACGCCRLIWDLLTDGRSRRAVEVAERCADGEATEGQREQARLAASAARRRVTPPRGSAPTYAGAIAAHQALCDPGLLPDVASMFCLDLPSALGNRRPAQSALLRDLCGNPWRPAARPVNPEWDLWYAGGGGGRVDIEKPPRYLRPDWLTPAVLALARAAYEERRQDGLLDPDRLAVLADALEDAGCQSEELLRHLRGWEWWDVGTSGGIRGPLRGPHARGCWAIDLVLGKE
jgi:hypothetical protein